MIIVNRVNRNRISSNEKILAVLRQKFEEGIITYASPTTDHTYKAVFLGANEISREFCNALLKISMPAIELSARSVRVMSEHVDAIFKDFYLAIKNFVDVPEPQNLKVDALFCADMEDGRRADRVMQDRRGTAIQKPAYILGEMQVSEQDFGMRLMSYGSKIFGGSAINLKDGHMPLPLYGVGICMWDNASFVEDLGTLRSCGIEKEVMGNQKFTEISLNNVFLGKLKSVKLSDSRATIDESLENGRKKLKQNIIKYFRGGRQVESIMSQFSSIASQRLLSDVAQQIGALVEQLNAAKERLNSIDLEDDDTLAHQFDDLSLEEKKVYLWLEFISFAHLMTGDHVEASLECLGTDDNAKQIFKNAYKAIKFNFGGNMSAEQVKRNYPDLWGFAAEAVEARQQTIVTTANSIETSAELFGEARFVKAMPQYVEKLKLSNDLLAKIAQELDAREAVSLEVKNAFKNEVARIAKQVTKSR